MNTKPIFFFFFCFMCSDHNNFDLDLTMVYMEIFFFFLYWNINAAFHHTSCGKTNIFICMV